MHGESQKYRYTLQELITPGILLQKLKYFQHKLCAGSACRSCIWIRKFLSFDWVIPPFSSELSDLGWSCLDRRRLPEKRVESGVHSLDSFLDNRIERLHLLDFDGHGIVNRLHSCYFPLLGMSRSWSDQVFTSLLAHLNLSLIGQL